MEGYKFMKKVIEKLISGWWSPDSTMNYTIFPKE